MVSLDSMERAPSWFRTYHIHLMPDMLAESIQGREVLYRLTYPFERSFVLYG